MGCTDPNCPYVHDLGSNYLMPRCTDNAGRVCTTESCSRGVTCIYTHTTSQQQTALHTTAATSATPTTAAPLTTAASTFPAHITSAADYRMQRSNTVNTAVAIPATPTWQPNIQNTNTDTVMLQELMAQFTPDFFMQLGASAEENSPINRLPGMQSLVVLIAQPRYQCTNAQNYVTITEPTVPTTTALSSITGMSQRKTFTYKDSLFIPSSVSKEEMQILIGVFSRGLSAFRCAPALELSNSPTLQNIISILTPLGFDSTDPGCIVFFQLYLRMRCVREIHPTTEIPLLNKQHLTAYGKDAYYGTRSFCSYTKNELAHNTGLNLLDQEQILGLEYILHCFHTDITATENTHKMHFIAQIATYIREATDVFKILNRCIMQFMSGDYKCSPLKFDGRRKNTELTVINRSHPIYTNYSGMLTRANTDDVSESDIYIDPAWVGFHHPSHVTLMVGQIWFLFICYVDVRCFGY